MWRHFLLGNHFKLVTDQHFVAAIYNNQQKVKVKNEKIQLWKLELFCFHYNALYHPGSENVGANALTRAYCFTLSCELQTLNSSLCHPGVARMFHFVRSKNLPLSKDDVKRVTSQCNICSQVKPNIYKPQQVPLFKT